MSENTEHHSPLDDELDKLFASHPVTPSKDFTDKTIARIMSHKESGDIKTRSNIINFPLWTAGFSAIAASLVIGLILFNYNKSNISEDKPLTVAVAQPVEAEKIASQRGPSQIPERKREIRMIANNNSTSVKTVANNEVPVIANIEATVIADEKIPVIADNKAPIIANKEVEDIYSDEDYIDFEELLLMNEALTSIAYLDDNMNFSSLLEN